MTTYLDIIPKDLLYIILHKVNDDSIEQIEELSNFDTTFWENRIRYKVGKLNLNLIPQWFYNYRGKSMKLIMKNYNKLLFYYEESITLIGFLETGSYRVRTEMVTNIEAYVHPEIYLSDDYFEDEGSTISISRKGDNFQLKFDDIIDTHTLTYQQIIDLLTHIQCNGYYILN